MAVKITRKLSTNGKGASAYKFIVRKNAAEDLNTYQRGREIERVVRERGKVATPPRIERTAD